MNFLPQVLVFLIAACIAVPLSIAGPGGGPELTAAGVLTDILKAARELQSG